jgi:hypothetical protein
MIVELIIIFLVLGIIALTCLCVSRNAMNDFAHQERKERRKITDHLNNFV